MGIMLQRSKIAEDLLVTMAQLFGPVRGGLGISVVFVGALLAATTGLFFSCSNYWTFLFCSNYWSFLFLQ